MRPQGDILYIDRAAGHYGIYRPGGSFDLRHRWATKPYINMFAIPVNISANNGEYITFEVPYSNTQRYTDVVARQVNNNLFPPTQK